MKTHELARKLLSLPDVNVAISANGHRYSTFADRNTHGSLKGIFIEETRWSNELQKGSEPQTALVIGNILDSVNTIRLDIE